MIIQGCFGKEIKPSKANGNRVSHRVVQRSYNTLIKDSKNCQKQYFNADAGAGRHDPHQRGTATWARRGCGPFGARTHPILVGRG